MIVENAFAESFEYIRRMAENRPSFENHYGKLGGGMNMLPKPTAGKLPLLITGGSQQDNDWIAKHGDGWMLYPRNTALQSQIISEWRDQIAAAGRPAQPVMEPLYIDITDDPHKSPQPIHLGLRLGINRLRDYLKIKARNWRQPCCFKPAF